MVSYDKRVGTYGINTFGSKMKVIKYNSHSDIWVEFERGEPVHTNWKAFINGQVRNPYDKTVYEVGYIGKGKHKASLNSKLTQKYTVWNGMLRRGYSEEWLKKYPTYSEVSVCEKWHNFQEFGDWYDTNYYEVDNERMHLDKDILVKGNKIYSPETSIFLPQRINYLFLKRKSDRGNLPIGVSFNKGHKKYSASFGNGNRNVYVIGYYDTPEEAFSAYKTHKESYIKKVADEYKDKIPLRLYESMVNYIVEIND